jgi:hypothetical protein
MMPAIQLLEEEADAAADVQFFPTLIKQICLCA